ncbi:MAG: hypothetical protein K9L62_02260 [Vallitaleaceae bacterium]|nr:hypothetical protein [Vallitaleaceae bacterium]
MNEKCGPDLPREHERRITEATHSADRAHSRIDGLVELFKDFTGEMRESNSNINAMVTQVTLLTEQIKHIVEATKRHEEDIESIKDNMETKDTVLKLYNKVEDSNSKHEKGMDAIMEKLRQTEKAIEDHKMEPAIEALAERKALEKSIKNWLVVLVGTIVSGFVLMYIGLK